MQEFLMAMMLVTSPVEFECLSKNIYFESRNQSHLGQIAVAQVVLNRVDDMRYPDSICKVVTQGYEPGRRDCQFSWFCDGLSDDPKNEELWFQSQMRAAEALQMYDNGLDITDGSTHYHSTKVSPRWAPTLYKVMRIDDHIFYRWDQ